MHDVLSLSARLSATVAVATAFACAAVAPASAQVPVIDTENLAIAKDTAASTEKILESNRDILSNVTSTLQAVTGDRSSAAQGVFASAALGTGGFSFAQAPDLGSMLTGGAMSWGGLTGPAASNASSLINSLKLVSSLSANGSQSGNDILYSSGVSLVTGLLGMVGATQQAAQSRVGQFQQAGAVIGTSQDIKGAIDQNTQLQLQTGLVSNELIGVVNGMLASQASDRMQMLQAQSERIRTFSDSGAPSTLSLTGPTTTTGNATVEPRYAE